MSALNENPWPLRVKVLVSGALTVGCGLILLVHEQELLAMARVGRWNAALPILIAFLFSFLHGNFTSGFWELLGVRARNDSGPGHREPNPE